MSHSILVFSLLASMTVLASLRRVLRMPFMCVSAFEPPMRFVKVPVDTYQLRLIIVLTIRREWGVVGGFVPKQVIQKPRLTKSILPQNYHQHSVRNIMSHFL